MGRASRNLLPHRGHPVSDLGGPAPLRPWPLPEGGLRAPGPNPPAALGLTSWAPSSLLTGEMGRCPGPWGRLGALRCGVPSAESSGLSEGHLPPGLQDPGPTPTPAGPLGLTHIQIVLHRGVQHHQVCEERAQVGNSALDDTLWHGRGADEPGPRLPSAEVSTPASQSSPGIFSCLPRLPPSGHGSQTPLSHLPGPVFGKSPRLCGSWTFPTAKPTPARFSQAFALVAAPGTIKTAAGQGTASQRRSGLAGRSGTAAAGGKGWGRPPPLLTGRPAPCLSQASHTLTVSFGRFWALLGFISRVANLEVPSCQVEDRVSEIFLSSPASPPAALTLGLGHWYTTHWAGECGPAAWPP